MTKTQKTNTKANAISQEDLDEMAEMSDEKNTKTAPRFSLASLKINGKEGGYYKTVLLENGDLKLDDDGKSLLEEIKNPSGIILRPRKSFQFIGADRQLFTNEGGNTPNSLFSVFEKKETKKGFSVQMIFKGTPAQLKEKFPQMKMVQIIYFLLDKPNELVKLKVKGMSLGKLFDYWKEFGSNEHLFQFRTILGEEKQKNQFGKFVVSTFKKGEAIKDLAPIKENLELIKTKIEQIEEYYAERDAEMANYQADRPINPEDLDPDYKPEAEEYEGASSRKFKKREYGGDIIDPEQVETAMKKKQDEQDEIDVDEIPFG